MKKEFYTQNHLAEDPRWSLVIDEDEKVCYGYLLFENELVSDVWLFNNIIDVSINEWDYEGNLPFAMPTNFLNDFYKKMYPFEAIDLVVTWLKSESVTLVRILYLNNVIAEISSDLTYGSSAFVNQNNSLTTKLIC